MIPPFYPDQAKPYISESEAQSLFQRVDEIFKKTGNPICPFILIPIIGITMTIGIIRGFLYQKVVNVPLVLSIAIGVPFVLLIGWFVVFMILRCNRKRDVTELIEQWNRTEGVPKGLYLALGSDNGISPDDFWLGIYPLVIRGQYGPSTVMTAK